MRYIKKLEVAAEREKMFLKHAPVNNTIFSGFENAKQDPVSNLFCLTTSVLKRRHY